MERQHFTASFGMGPVGVVKKRRMWQPWNINRQPENKNSSKRRPKALANGGAHAFSRPLPERNCRCSLSNAYYESLARATLLPTSISQQEASLFDR